MRILIATVTAGAGHVQAAVALEEAWLQVRPQDAVERLDLLTLFSPLHKKIYSDGYVKLIAHAPELWGLMFNKTDSPRLVQKLARWRSRIGSNSSRRFAAFVRQFKPDAILCTHFLPVELLGRLRKKWPGPPPLTVSIVTDFEAHALWMDANVDLYCVAAEETKARLLARGAPADRVLVTGIPISAKFSGRVDAAALRKELGLRDDLPVLLVLSGGFGMGPVAQILAALDKIERPFQTLVVAGRNERLRRDLASADHRHPTRVLGFVTNMNELMAVSELLITKPGGLTASEALAMGKPLFILHPIPGQEAANSDFLLEHGAAAKASRVEDLPFRVDQLLGSKKLADMARAASALARPSAASDICRAVSGHLGARPLP
jgi:processive 1,2-diacylglycerol beta-glucosyltransferase